MTAVINSNSTLKTKVKTQKVDQTRDGRFSPALFFDQTGDLHSAHEALSFRVGFLN